MTTLREAAQQALEALEALELNNSEWKSLADSGDAGYWRAEDQDYYKQTSEAIAALRAALAHQEPDLRNANPIGLTPPQKALQLAQFRADALAQQEAIERHRAIEAALKERNT